jgi:hypothetical protein
MASALAVASAGGVDGVLREYSRWSPDESNAGAVDFGGGGGIGAAGAAGIGAAGAGVPGFVPAS